MTFLGLWIARFTDDDLPTEQLTKFHLCETEINDGKYMRCGRIMRERKGTALAPVKAPPTVDVTCRQCKPKAPAIPEDAA